MIRYKNGREEICMRVIWPHNFSPDVPNAGNFMHRLAAGVKRIGVHVDLLYLGDLSKPWNMLAARSEVHRRCHDYDLVHAQYGSACAFVTCGVPKPSVLSLRGSDWHQYRGPRRTEALHAAFANVMSRISMKRFDVIITMSERMALEVRSSTDCRTVVSIPDPIDTDLFSPRGRQHSRVECFGASDDAPWVLFTTLSTSNPAKRIELALEAVRIARERMNGLEIKVASGVPHEKMPWFVSACDVVLCTSTHEGWPNSLKEALACGIPFVSTDVSDMAMIADRHAACSVCPPDPVVIADRLCNALESDADGGLREEVMGMGVEVTSKRLVTVYEELLATKVRCDH
jgi:glycosyltransferase involved in cell wall biosynthesis